MRSPLLSRWKPTHRPIPPIVGLGLTILIVLGIFLHGYRLGYKLYWHDEVYTSLRAAGYQSTEIGTALFSDQTFAPDDLLTYQAIKPNSTPQDTLRSLAQEDPQHPPLYFLLTRWWMRLFGDSVIATRSLAVLFSLLALPVMYALSLELFASSLAAQLSTLFLALSPFDILFAQVARQYSLLTLFTLLSSWLLLRALRPNRQPWLTWALYILASTGGLYTHPFFGLTLFAHGAYTLLRQFLMAPSRVALGSYAEQQRRSPFWDFLKAMIITTVLFAPWLWVLFGNFGRALSTTSWSQGFPGWEVMTKFWILSFTSVLFDINVDFESIWVYVIRAPFLVLIGYGFWVVARQTRPETHGFIQANFWVPFLLLAIPDLVLDTQRSTVSRYLIPCYPAIQLAVGYGLAIAYHRLRRPLWNGILGLIVSGSLASILISAHTPTWWNRVPSYFNAAIAQHINNLPNPQLVSDAGNDGTNLGDLLSLARLLADDVEILLLSQASDVDLERATQSADAVFFRPSEPLRSRTNALPNAPLEPVPDTGANLWHVPSS